MKWPFMAALLLFLLLFSASPPAWCSDEDQGWNAVGVRWGFMALQRHAEFHQYEVYATYGLPWSVRRPSGWGIALQANVSAGVLHTHDQDGFIGTLGPGVIFDRAGGKGLALDFGGDLCVLSRYRFTHVNFNGNPLFEGHVGLAYRFDSGIGLSYRFQHMSNGGLGLHGPINTGLDLHLFGVSWNF